MPVRGVYSNVIEPNQFIDPINLNLYAQGMQYKEGIAKQNLQDISALKNSVFNIPTYGKDKEKLLEIENNLKGQLQNMNLSNLGDLSTASQIKNLIQQAANDRDVQAISQRYNAYATELKNKKEAESKGHSYTSPILDQAEEYYGSGVYKTDTRFNGNGWLTPNLLKDKAEIIKNAPKVKKNVKVGNYWVSKESPDMDWVAMQMQDLYSRPDVQKTINYNFEKNNRNRDWITEGVQGLQQKLQKAEIALSIDPNDQKARDFIQKNSVLLQNPQLLGEIEKRKALNADITNSLLTDIQAANYESEGDMDADDFTLRAIDHQYRMLEKQADDLSLGASAKGWSLQEVMSDPVKMQEALQASQDIKYAEFSEKENLKLQSKIQAQVKKSQLLGNIKEGDILEYFDSKSGGNTNTTWGIIKSKTANKKVADQSKPFILDLINTLRIKNGENVVGSDPTKLTIGSDGSLKYDNSIIPFYGEEKLDNLTKLANPKTYMNAKVTFTEPENTQTPSKPKASTNLLHFPHSKNPNLNYKTDVAYNAEQQKWVTAPIVNTQEEKDNIPVGSHYIYNGEMYIKQ